MSVVSVNEAILQIEKALDQAPGALSFCVEHFPYSAFLLDPTGTVLYANRHAQENLGRTDGMIGKKCREIICRHKKDPDDCPLKTVQKMENPSCRRVMESAFGNYRSHLEPLMDSAGKLLGTILSLSLCPGGAALRESSEPVEDPYKLLFVSSSNGVLLLDRLGKIVDVNPGFCSMFKVELSEVLGQQIPWFSRFCKNGGALVPEIIEGIMRGEKSIAPTVLELVRPDGRPVIVEFSARALQRDDTTVGIQVIYQDITQSEEAKKALELSEERYRAMFEAIDSGVAVYEAVDGGSDFIFKNFNGAAEKITKLDRGSALGTRLLEHFPHMDKTPLVAALRRVYETGISEDLPPFFYKDDVREGWRANTIYRLPTGEVVAVFT
ncbi:PAS domain-containing protein, partial [Myxococcota bacterium]|nr:PAS domain-containing protein [Myxococcota bacterium]